MEKNIQWRFNVKLYIINQNGFIDININKAREQGAKYAIINVLNYTGYKYSEFRYSTYDPENETFIEEIPCTKEEFEEATGKVVYPQQSQILRYKDIELLFEEKNPNQISIRKDGDLLGVVIGKDGFVWNHNCCVSGDYLYWSNDNFVKRIDIIEILEDLEL